MPLDRRRNADADAAGRRGPGAAAGFDPPFGITAIIAVFGSIGVAFDAAPIVLPGSLVGVRGAPLSTTRAAVKGFVQSFAEGFAAELRPLGISVLSVAPGPVGTGSAARAGMTMTMSDGPDKVARGTLAALGRGGTVSGFPCQRPGPVAGDASAPGTGAGHGSDHEGHVAQAPRPARDRGLIR